MLFCVCLRQSFLIDVFGDMSLTKERRNRFARHIGLPEIGEAGQERLLTGRVLLIGAGGLGSAAGLYLAAAGVGTIGIMDSDRVELSNLQRQILHSTADLGRPKVESASERMLGIDPGLSVRAYPERLNSRNAGAILGDYEFVVDATDNFESKFLIADVCHEARKPYSHAGIDRFRGQTMTVHPGETACYRCLFERPPVPRENRPAHGPLGAVPGVIGAIQATEAIKHLLGVGEPLVNRLLTYDALTMSFRCIPLNRNPGCPLCGGERK